MPSPLKIGSFGVTQEAMYNTAKHCRGDLVRFVLAETGWRMELFIPDNGRGFGVEKVRSPAADKAGLDLSSMRKHAELCGGSFAVGSAGGKGATIRGSWSLVREQEC